MRGILSFVAVSVIFDIFSGVLHAQKLDKGVSLYGEFWAKDGNPSKIEKDFLYMWENDAFLVRKGLAHMNPNGFTYISWLNLLKKYMDIQSEANTLRRLAALEKKTKLRPAKARKKENK